MSPDEQVLVSAGEGGDDGSRPASGEETLAPSEAFQALGGETRLAVVRALAAADGPLAFSELFAATDEETTAGFAYHLRQLDGRFLRQREDERYELTDAGRAAARAVRAGTYTERVTRDPMALDAECPLCGEGALTARVVDNVTEVACGACETTLSRLSLPPGGYADRAGAELVAAVDAHHRRRIEAFADGVCPECAGVVDATVEPADGAVGGGHDGTVEADPSSGSATAEQNHPVQATFACEACGADLSCPVALATLDHPAVVAFYHDHGEDVTERPLWNVGSEWRERVVSTDPRCVVVSARLDAEVLSLYVAGDGTVVGHRRRTAVDTTPPTVDSGADAGEDRDDDPDGGSRPLADPPAAGASADDRVERASEDPDVTESPTDGATA
ncbi:ArsR family transcriptional regulator [Halobacteriales archaeon QH_8_68_33]|nr:MAG: ArsR family transcriptional regulator [Halobacteriales archaeon QH_8_68_33]